MTIREIQIKITVIIRHPTDTRTAADRQTDRVHTEQGTQRTCSLRASSERKQSDIATLGFSLATVEKNSTNSPAKPSHRKNLPERKALSLIFIQLLTVKKPNSQTHVEWFVLFCSKTLDRPGKRKSQLKRYLSQIGPWSNFFTVDEYVRAPPTVSGAFPRQLCLDCIRKVKEARGVSH